MDINLFRELAAISGPSGYEGAVSQFIADKIKGLVDELYTDNIGNLIAFKKGRIGNGKKVVVSAHTDEVGFFISSINSDGSLNFETLGGIPASVLAGGRVQLTKNKIQGVISAKPGHLASPDERNKFDGIGSFVIDIGAFDEDDAKKYCNIGDTAVFEADYLEISKDIVAHKAVDDRFGCFAMMNLIEKSYDADIYFVFTVQEELGLRGAKAVAAALKPDISIVIESTTAADIPTVSGEKQVCKLGEGAVVSIMDKGALYSEGLIKFAVDIAKSREIRYQYKMLVAGGNDSGAFSQGPGGCETLAISLPTRFLHTQNCLFSKGDMAAVERFVGAVLEEIQNY